MPPGIPVATVAIDGALNTAILAIQILAVGSLSLGEKLKKFKEEQAKKVMEKDKKLQEEALTWKN